MSYEQFFMIFRQVYRESFT